jgi:HAD superfamily hydrolase (TIGR01509 family)
MNSLDETRAVLFDMDGVLIDAREWHFQALNQALGIFGYNISQNDHVTRFDGMTTKSKLSVLSQEEGLPLELHSLISEVKQDRTLRIAAALCYPNMQHQILLSRLKTLGIKVGVVTNSIRSTTEFMLNYAGIMKYLDVLVTNEDVSEPKPSPEGYEKAMKSLGIKPSKTWVVEDGHYGILAAEQAGANVIQVISPQDVQLELFTEIFPEIFV